MRRAPRLVCIHRLSISAWWGNGCGRRGHFRRERLRAWHAVHHDTCAVFQPLLRKAAKLDPALTITRLANADGTTYPPVLGTQTDLTGHSHYVGLNYATGQEFHSSWQLGGPESFSLVGYVVGFAEGVAGMRAGGRREIVVPPALAYGSGSYGAVGPNETLIFVVDLLKVS